MVNSAGLYKNAVLGMTNPLKQMTGLPQALSNL
jgi:hypothetical protein